MAGADIYTQPSAWEGFGLAVAEAMACGLPPIISDADSLPEIVTHEKTGLVVKIGDANGLAESLIRLLNDPARARELGDAAEIECRARFSVDRMVDEYAALYNECL